MSAGEDPSIELWIVSNVAKNPLALVNDPEGSGHEKNIFDLLAWNRGNTGEIQMYFFVGPGGIRKGEELWLDYGPVSTCHLFMMPCRAF